MSAYKLNGNPITEQEFKHLLHTARLNPAVTAGLAAFSICMFFLTAGAFLSNSVTASVLSVIIMAVLRVVNFIRIPTPITAGSILRLIGNIVFFAGLWQHNWVLVILGVLLSLKFSLSAR